MRRGYAIAAFLALLAVLGLWGAERLDKGWFRTGRTARPPPVLAGRDLHAEPPRRDLSELAKAVIRCEYTGSGDPGALVAIGEDTVTATDLSLRLDPGDWHVYWLSASGRDVELGTFTLESGDAHTCRLPPWGTEVSGHVRTPDGRPLEGALVRACTRRPVETDADGAFRVRLTRAGCTLQAMWNDGLLARYSDPVPLSPFDVGRDIALELDDAPVAGMGIALDMTPEGARVGRVHPGTPAEHAGLEAGDLIAEIDGRPTLGMDADTFIRMGTGQEGSTVTLEVVRDGEDRRFSFRRERIAVVDTG